jgi:uncharacterized protein VirK/YbjX
MNPFDTHEHLLALYGASPSVSLRSAVPRNLPPLSYIGERIKLKLRSLAHPAQTRRWLSLLNSHPAFGDYLACCPRLVYKIYRPYLTTRLGVAGRLEAIRQHYQLVFGLGLGPLIAAAARAAVPLADIDGKDAARYQVSLRALSAFEREGELVLQLCHEGQPLYSVAFTFCTLDGLPTVAVGCIQGNRQDDALDAIRAATRALHGARPKQLLIELVRHVAFELGCARMRLVGNGNRAPHVALRKGRVHADYDSLWLELDAIARADGDFELPCRPLREPDFEAIASKKRSEARKRYQLTSATAARLAARLGGLAAA